MRFHSVTSGQALVDSGYRIRTICGISLSNGRQLGFPEKYLEPIEGDPDAESLADVKQKLLT